MTANEGEETTTLTTGTPLRSKNAKKDEDVEANDEEITAVEVVGADTSVEKGTKKKNSRTLALDIISLICMSFFTIFFICGSSFFHPDTFSQIQLNLNENDDFYGYSSPSYSFDISKSNRPAEPAAFFTVGALFFIASLSIEVYKRKADGVLHIVMTSLCIFGAFLWFVASFMLLSDVAKNEAFSGLWITGTLFTLAFYTFDAVMIFTKSGPKPLFKTASVFFAWVANILLLSGGAKFASVYNASPLYVTFGDIEDYAGLFISGSVFYIFFTVFYGLSLFKPNVNFMATATSE